MKQQEGRFLNVAGCLVLLINFGSLDLVDQLVFLAICIGCLGRCSVKLVKVGLLAVYVQNNQLSGK